MSGEKVITWVAICCASFALTFFGGTAILRLMWSRKTS